MERVTPVAVLLILTTVVLTVVGQILVKKGMLEVGGSPTDFGLLPQFVWSAFTNLSVILGLGCAVAASVVWVIAISRTQLSFGYPFMALAIVLVLALSGVIFGEQVPSGRWLGVGIVCIGIIVASQAQ